MQSIKTRDSSFFERHLGGTEFSGREIIRMLVPFYPDLLSIFFISMHLYHPHLQTTADIASITMKLLYLSNPMLMLCLPGTQVMPSALRCFVDNVFPSASSLGVMWIINIPVGYLLAIPAGHGLMGVWISSRAGWVIRAPGYT